MNVSNQLQARVERYAHNSPQNAALCNEAELAGQRLGLLDKSPADRNPESGQVDVVSRKGTKIEQGSVDFRKNVYHFTDYDDQCEVITTTQVRSADYSCTLVNGKGQPTKRTTLSYDVIGKTALCSKTVIGKEGKTIYSGGTGRELTVTHFPGDYLNEIG